MKMDWVQVAVVVVFSILAGLAVVLLSGDGGPAETRPTPTPTPIEFEIRSCWKLVSDGRGLNQVVCP